MAISATNQLPVYGQVPLAWTALLTNQTLARDETTAANSAPVLLGTASSRGAIIHALWIQPLGDFSANVLRLCRRFSGSNTNLIWGEWSITAVTSSNNTTAIAGQKMTAPPILTPVDGEAWLLAPGESLYVALGTASGTACRIWCQGMHYWSDS